MWKTFIRLKKHKNDDLRICGSCISLSTCFIEADIISGKSLIYDMNFGFKSLYLIVSKNKIGFLLCILSKTNLFKLSNSVSSFPINSFQYKIFYEFKFWNSGGIKNVLKSVGKTSHKRPNFTKLPIFSPNI